MIKRIFTIFLSISILTFSTYAECVKIDEQLGMPVTDYTGKTVYTWKKVTWECNNTTKVQTGCKQYEVKKYEGDMPYIKNVGYDTIDYSNDFMKAVAMANMVEQLNHIWSGWHGYCENGWFTDFSWIEDPFFLISTAWTLAGAGVLGEAAKGTVDSVNNAMDVAKSNMSSWIGGMIGDGGEFASCMASNGLSFTNLVSSAVNYEEGMSDELKSGEFETRSITNEQYEFLKNKYGDDFNKHFSATESLANNNTYDLTPKTTDAYINSTATLCSQSASVAGAFLAIAKEGGISLTSGTSAITTLLQAYNKLNPLVGLAINIAMKIITSFDKCDACDDEECAAMQEKIQLQTNIFQKHAQCHYLEEECSWEIDLGVKEICMRHKKHYCCYDQIMTRIFVEGIKPQLGKDWSSCNDITLSDLKRVSFRPCNPGETPNVSKCFPKNKYEELKSYILAQMKSDISPDSLIQQGISAMGVSR